MAPHPPTSPHCVPGLCTATPLSGLSLVVSAQLQVSAQCPLSERPLSCFTLPLTHTTLFFFLLRKISPELTAANPPLFAEEDWP